MVKPLYLISESASEDDIMKCGRTVTSAEWNLSNKGVHADFD